MPSTHPMFMGVDLAPQQKPSAIAIVERITRSQDLDPATYQTASRHTYNVRHLQRLLPGTSYLDIAAAIRKILETPELAEARLPVIVDVTAMGKPVLELMREQLRLPGVLFRPVCLLAQETPGENRIPKRDLLQNLNLLFQQRQVIISRSLPQAATLLDELQEVAARDREPSSEDTSWREQPNDDLVFAVALAAWYARRSIGASFESPRPLFLF